LTALAISVFQPLPSPANASGFSLIENGWEDRIRAAIFKVADTDFEEGLAMIGEYISAFPENPGGYFFYAAGVQEKIQKHNDLGELKRFYKYAEKCKEICEKILKRKPGDVRARFFLGGIHGYIGLLEAKQRNLFRAFINGIEAKKHLEWVVRKKPDLPDTYFGLGMLYYFSSRKGDEGGRLVSWIIRKFITHGKNMKRDGVEMIKRAVMNNALSSDYALAGLMWIHLYEREYDSAEQIAETMARRFTRDFASRWVLGRVALIKGDCAGARARFREILEISARQGIPLSRYPDIPMAIKMADLCQAMRDKKWDEARRLNEEIGRWLDDDPKVSIEYQDEKNVIEFWKQENDRIRKKLRFIAERRSSRSDL